MTRTEFVGLLSLATRPRVEIHSAPAGGRTLSVRLFSDTPFAGKQCQRHQVWLCGCRGWKTAEKKLDQYRRWLEQWRARQQAEGGEP